MSSRWEGVVQVGVDQVGGRQPRSHTRGTRRRLSFRRKGRILPDWDDGPNAWMTKRAIGGPKESSAEQKSHRRTKRVIHLIHFFDHKFWRIVWQAHFGPFGPFQPIRPISAHSAHSSMNLFDIGSHFLFNLKFGEMRFTKNSQSIIGCFS